MKVKVKKLVAREAKEATRRSRFLESRFTKTSVQVPIKPKVEVEKKEDVQVRRLEFIKENTKTILKSWEELKEKSANGLERVLPHEWKSEWIEEVLHLNDLRTSGYKTIVAAVEADRPLLDLGKK